MCGIYCYRNKTNGKCYVGQSVNTKARFTRHLKAAFNPNEPEYNTAIHRAIRKYGIENFEIFMVEEVHPSQLDDREQYWINKMQSLTTQNGYNILPGGQFGAPVPEAGVKGNLSYEKKTGYKTPFCNPEVQKRISKVFDMRFGGPPLANPEIYNQTYVSKVRNGNIRCFRNLETGLVFTPKEAAEWCGVKSFLCGIYNYFQGKAKSCGKTPDGHRAHWEEISYDEYLASGGKIQ